MRPTITLAAAFKERLVIFDGAMGTEIYRNDVFVNQCFDELNLRRAELIRKIHQSYVDAGAEVLTSNTFGANRAELAKFGLADSVKVINAAGVRIAREVADAAKQPVYVAGSVGPLALVGQALDPVEVLAEQAGALVEAGADFILFETQPTRPAVENCLAAMGRLGGTAPFIISVVPPVRGMGDLDEEFLAALLAPVPAGMPEPFAWGINCGSGPDLLLSATEKAVRLVSQPLLVQPNAGEPRTVGGRSLYLTTPEYFATYAERYFKLGARGVGGCCGMTPDHIREAVRTLKPLAKAAQFEIREILPAAAQAEKAETPFPGRSKLAAKLAKGEWIRTVEITPPPGYDLASTVEKARLCQAAGIDAINIPDGPRASARISPFFTSLTIQREAGIEAVLHACARDRNLIGIQADLLACAGAGIRNILFITGDPPRLGKYPFASGVFDVDSIGMVRLQTRLNRGYDLAGQEIGAPTQAVISVGADPNALDLDREVERFRQKVAAGAHFAITQPVFDAKVLLKFIERVADCRIPVIAGVWPLASYRNATFMKNEVPGVVVPDWIVEKMGSVQDKEAQRQMGIEIARDTVAQIRGAVAGLQVSAPLGNVRTALAVLEG